jgi:hypothetical protein
MNTLLRKVQFNPLIIVFISTGSPSRRQHRIVHMLFPCFLLTQFSIRFYSSLRYFSKVVFLFKNILIFFSDFFLFLISTYQYHQKILKNINLIIL